MTKPNMPPVPGLPTPKIKGNPEVIKACQLALANAQSGSLMAIGQVMILANGAISIRWAGGLEPQMVLGCEKMKLFIIDAAFKEPQSSIIQPGKMQ